MSVDLSEVSSVCSKIMAIDTPLKHCSRHSSHPFSSLTPFNLNWACSDWQPRQTGSLHSAWPGCNQSECIRFRWNKINRYERFPRVIKVKLATEIGHIRNAPQRASTVHPPTSRKSRQHCNNYQKHNRWTQITFTYLLTYLGRQSQS